MSKPSWPMSRATHSANASANRNIVGSSPLRLSKMFEAGRDVAVQLIYLERETTWSAEAPEEIYVGAGRVSTEMKPDPESRHDSCPSLCISLRALLIRALSDIRAPFKMLRGRDDLIINSVCATNSQVSRVKSLDLPARFYKNPMQLGRFETTTSPGAIFGGTYQALRPPVI